MRAAGGAEKIFREGIYPLNRAVEGEVEVLLRQFFRG